MSAHKGLATPVSGVSWHAGTDRFFRLFDGKGLTLDNDISPIELATELTVAWLSNSNTRVSAEDVPAFLKRMVETISGVADNKIAADPEAPIEYTPATTARKSLASPDHIISMIDGKPYRTLRRHLTTNGLTPEEYRERYSLKPDYPMVAPSYSDSRREMAKKIGLGRKPSQTNAPTADTKTPKAPRKTAADAAKEHLSDE